MHRTWARSRNIRRMAQVWLLLLIAGSLQPVRPGPVVALHREIHWAAFAGAAFLLLLLSRSRSREVRNMMALVILGLSLEYVQHLLYRKPMEWQDVRNDALAVLAAFAVHRLTGLSKVAAEAEPCAVESETDSQAGDGAR